MKRIYNFTSKQNGFSLIELMVGLTIGLLVVLAVSQTMGVFDTQRRGTAGTADAQTNGNVALYTMARDLKQAGYALMPRGTSGIDDSPQDCTTVNVNSSGVTSINPIDITNGTAVAGVSNASDTITIRYGSGSLGGAFTTLNNAAVSVSTDRSLDSNLGCSVGDVALIMSGATCNLTKVTAVSTVTSITDPITVKLSNAVGAADSDFACLGTWNEVIYRVVNSNLERNGTAILSDVVNIQAQYGISSLPNSNRIVQWVEPSGTTWAAPTLANRKLIKAVRVAVVTRNPQIDRQVVTTACSSTSLASPTGLCAWEGLPAGGTITTASPAPTVDLSSADISWDRYRYRVFETVIPLRNGIWAKSTL